MKRPIRLTTTGGFTLLEIMIVVAIIGLLAAIAIPSFIRSRRRSAATACITNLRQIEDAKAQWALETHKNSTALPVDADLFGPGLYIKAKPICRGGGQYDLRTVGEITLCDQPGHEL
jgi:prepilin-type N-terminal cleavage/methylation domain-containing protein